MVSLWFLTGFYQTLEETFCNDMEKEDRELLEAITDLALKLEDIYEKLSELHELEKRVEALESARGKHLMQALASLGLLAPLVENVLRNHFHLHK